MADNDIIRKALEKVRADQAAAQIVPPPALQAEAQPMSVVPPAVEQQMAANIPTAAGPETTAAMEPQQPAPQAIVPAPAGPPTFTNVPIAITPVAPTAVSTTIDFQKILTEPPKPPKFSLPKLKEGQTPSTGVMLPGVAEAAVEKAKPQEALPPPPEVVQSMEQLGLAQPTPEQVSEAVKEVVAPITAAKAQQAAAEVVQDVADIEQKQQEELQKSVDQTYSKMEDEVRTKSLPELLQGSWGEKLGAALAVALGGVAQGLMGTKTNPTVDFLNSMADRQAAKDKLSMEQRDMLRKMMYEAAQMKISQQEAQTNNEYRKGMLALERQKLAQESQLAESSARQKLIQQQANVNKYSGFALTPEQLATLTPEEQSFKVYTPDGKAVLVPGAAASQKFRDYQLEIGNALDSVKELQNIAKVPFKKLSLEQRARVQSLTMKLTGALRLPYTGPGVLTDDERSRLIGIIGDPTALLRLASVEKAKLNQLKNDLEANLQNAARTYGIKERMVPTIFRRVPMKDQSGRMVEMAKPEYEILQQIKMQLPNLSEAQIKDIMSKTYPEL